MNHERKTIVIMIHWNLQKRMYLFIYIRQDPTLSRAIIVMKMKRNVLYRSGRKIDTVAA